MKKLLLVSTALLTGAFAVNAQSGRVIVKAHPTLTTKNIMVDDTYAKAAAAFFNPQKNTNPAPFTASYYSVGFTQYDLQSNNSIGRRIIDHPDGTLSMVWTTDDAGGTWPNRGTGWNYWTGAGLKYPGGVSSRLEPTRTGFANIGLLGNGTTIPYKEVTMAHNGAPYDFKMGTDSAKGSPPWTFVTAGATLPANLVPGWTSGAGVNAALWGKIATGGSDGNSIHLLANYFPTDADSIKHMLSPFVYSRSTDGGQSWDIQSMIMPGYDSTRTQGGDAESYAIDAEGATVAVLHGGLGEDLTLWKSTDNGGNWVRTLVDSFPFAPSIDAMGGPTDTAVSNDGAISVVIDPTGKTHVAFATERILDNGTPNDGNFYLFPGDMDLVYWNDVAKQQVHIPIALADIDGTTNGGDGDGNYTLGVNTTVYAASMTGGRYGNRALLNSPSIAVDGNNIFILFSLPADADSTPTNGKSFRDIWIVASQDGGATWGTIQNVSCTVGDEEFFISLAKRVGNTHLHILYQYDNEPGTVVQNANPPNTSEIRYSVLNKAEVLAGTANCKLGANGVTEQTTTAFSIANAYPNPTSGATSFDITMKQRANVTLNVYNNLGQNVYSSVNNFSTGKHVITLDATSFASGLYFYTIKSGTSSVTGKFIRE